MECSFALTGKDYVIIAADTTAARSIVKMKIDEDKIKTLSPHLLMAYSGESGSSTFLRTQNLLISHLSSSIDPCCIQVIPSNLPNTSSETSGSTTSATSIPCVHSPLRRGYVGRWQNRCARARLTPSTSSSADSTRQTSHRICTGSTISALWPRCLLPPMDMEAISRLVY
jgi:hypothetical protein